MIHKERCIVMDIDGTLCHLRQPGETYAELTPIEPIVETLRKYQEAGFYIILSTARNMQTHDGNLGRIIASTAPVLIDWLKRHDIPYDELHFGKPWQGCGGFYVDDKAVRPSEFLSLGYEEIRGLLDDEQSSLNSQREAAASGTRE